MKLLLVLLVWALVLILCWPLALIVIIAWPFVWLLSIPFRIAAVVLKAMAAFLTALIFLPARILGGPKAL